MHVVHVDYIIYRNNNISNYYITRRFDLINGSVYKYTVYAGLIGTTMKRINFFFFCLTRPIGAWKFFPCKLKITCYKV